jgi:hypothetical protein
MAENKGWQNHENAGGEHWRKMVVAQADEIQMLKEQLKQEQQEKYDLYVRIKELSQNIIKNV